MECTESLNVNKIADNLFEKQFYFHNYSSQPWTLENKQINEDHSKVLKQLSTLKETLNSVKSSLNDFDIKEWSSHTNFTNPSAKVLPHLRNSIHPELATQAWCKFYELLSYADVVPKDAKHICSVHLCEAPGGFICALNHYLKTLRKGVAHTWIANSLNPYYEGNTLDSCIVDDRLISRTLRSWCFGEDNTGDVLCIDFLQTLLVKCSTTFQSNNVNLITADGSLNCQNDPSQQESLVAPLHYTELLYALSILSMHGNLVIKMFTLFEEHSIGFMYILCCLFKTVSVVKPATSKAGNSEVYVISRDFCGLENCLDLVAKLKSYFPFDQFIHEKASFISISEIPTSYIIQHVACAKLFAEFQIGTIQNNIRFFRNVSDQFKSDMKTLQDMVTQKFVDECNIKKLPPKQCIVPSGVLRSKVKSNLQLRPKLEGSFTQRKTTDVEMHVAENGDLAFWINSEPSWIPKMTKQFWWNTTQAVVGKPVKDIHSSLFCATNVIVQYEHAFEQLIHRKQVLFPFEASGTISNRSLLENLMSVFSTLNFNYVNVVVEDSHLFHSNWLKNTISSGNSALKSMDVSFLNNVSNMETIKTNFFVSNLVSSQSSTKWPELEVRFLLVKIICYATRCLKNGGLCCFILPSVLMRLTAQILWVFSQCFEEISLHPIKAESGDPCPAIFFMGRNFFLVRNYTPHLTHLCNLMSLPNRELLELFPITALLHTDHAALFIHELQSANEKCLVEATLSLNSKAVHLAKE